MSGVTVAGPVNETIVLSIGSAENAVIAQQLADVVSLALQAASLKPVDYNGFRLPPPSTEASEEIVIKTSGAIILPAQAKAVIDNAARSVVLGGGGANETVLAGAGNLTFFTRSGSGELARIIHRTARNRPRPPNTWARDFIAKNFIKQPILIVVNDINGLALIAHFS